MSIFPELRDGAVPSLKTLTQREREVLALIGEGHSTEEIARRLHRSLETIRTHRRTLGRKLGVRTRVGLARIAIAAGLCRIEVRPELEAALTPTTERPPPKVTPPLSLPLSPPSPTDHPSDTHAAPPPTDRWLQTILEGTAAVCGEGALRVLVRTLARALGVRHVLLQEFVDTSAGRSLRTVAGCSDGRPSPITETPTEGSPWEMVAPGGVLHYASSVQELFPDAATLRNLSADGFLAVGLMETTGEAIGALTVVHDGPLRVTTDILMVLRIFAARAAVELSRLRAQRRAAQAESLAELLADVGEIATFECDLSGCVLRMNRHAKAIAAGRESELATLGWFALADPTDRPALVSQWTHTIAQRRRFHTFLRCEAAGFRAPVRVEASPLTSESGGLRGYLLAFHSDRTIKLKPYGLGENGRPGASE